MDAITGILQDFGFTKRDANKIAQQAYQNDLTVDDVQAWIDEAETSTSIYNPCGFVRARIEDGDKLPPRAAADCHHRRRYKYGSQFICPRCGARPCMCNTIPTQKENTQ